MRPSNDCIVIMCDVGCNTSSCGLVCVIAFESWSRVESDVFGIVVVVAVESGQS